MMTIIGISGSLRRGSYNTSLLRAALLMPDNVQLRIETNAGIPLYDGDLEAAEGIPQPVARLKEAVAAADGLFLVNPEYNNALPGLFKPLTGYRGHQQTFRASSAASRSRS